MFHKEIVKARKYGYKYIIFGIKGCYYSETAKHVASKVPKTKYIQVNINSVDTNELKKIVGDPSLHVTWPQIFKITPKRQKHISGGCTEFINQKDVQAAI